MNYYASCMTQHGEPHCSLWVVRICFRVMGIQFQFTLGYNDFIFAVLIKRVEVEFVDQVDFQFSNSIWNALNICSIPLTEFC